MLVGSAALCPPLCAPSPLRPSGASSSPPGGKAFHLLGLRGQFAASCVDASAPAFSTGDSSPLTTIAIAGVGVDDVVMEIGECVQLVQRIGKGVVYFGSSRIPSHHEFFVLAEELSAQIASLLLCSTWSGIGPGLMDAVSRGAMSVNRPVGGFKILLEATGAKPGEEEEKGKGGRPSFQHPYLQPDSYITCRSMTARKSGFLAAGVREREQDRTAFVVLPGGVGTLDELQDILSLVQVHMLHPTLATPVILMNYNGWADGLVAFLGSMRTIGCVAEGEVEGLWQLCRTNQEAMTYLENFYGSMHVCNEFKA
eukprot:TRINITY_DN15868_c0_g1_i1.p1 TRINITY_DN15868_c0_g1~~TRINITY_DN15868_c0_g1_i1.p1  ORF type:complete len:311 (+),score=70.44 TRINITY_DN15868_c0_g1_i1:120-1052(+)